MTPSEFQRNAADGSGCTASGSGNDIQLPHDFYLAADREKEISELKNLVNSLELILNNVYSGVIFCDRACNIIFMNKVYAELLGVVLGSKGANSIPLLATRPFTRLYSTSNSLLICTRLGQNVHPTDQNQTTLSHRRDGHYF